MNLKRLIVAVATLGLSAWAAAQAYPNRPITLVVPDNAGGGVDVLARTLADEMSKRMGQPVLIDNKPGAGGMLATQRVAKAEPDGYTLLMTYSAPVLTAPFIFPKMAYDVRRDLSFISQLCTGRLVVAVSTDKVPASVTTMKEFAAWGRANKGKVSYGSYGIGSAGHLISAYFNSSNGLEMVHAAYKGDSAMTQDLVGGQIHWGIASVGTLGPHMASGKIRALAVVADRRGPELPDVPTMAEAGFTDPEYKPMGWIALMGPANLPAAVQERLENVARAAATSAPMQARFQAFGMDVVANTGAQFRQEFEASLPVTERMVRLSGAKVQ